MDRSNPLLYPEDYNLKLLGDATYVSQAGDAVTVACWTDKRKPHSVLCHWDAYDADDRDPFEDVEDIDSQGLWITKDTFDTWLHWMNVTVTLRFHVAVPEVRELVEAVRRVL